MIFSRTNASCPSFFARANLAEVLWELEPYVWRIHLNSPFSFLIMSNKLVLLRNFIPCWWNLQKKVLSVSLVWSQFRALPFWHSSTRLTLVSYLRRTNWPSFSWKLYFFPSLLARMIPVSGSREIKMKMLFWYVNLCIPATVYNLIEFFLLFEF